MTRPQTTPLLSVPSTRNRQRVRARDWPRPPRRDPHVRVIAQLVEFGGADMSVIASSSRPWASATFIGAQHRVVVQFSGHDAHGNAARFADKLPEAEFSISGHIVADASVDEWSKTMHDEDATDMQASPSNTGDRLMLRITVLTVEDW